MPTSLLSIASSSLSVRYKEPFLSDGVNAKFAPQATGIYEGFRLKPSFSALSVDVQADASGASHAIYRNANGRTLGIRTVGSITLDLSAKLSKTVVVCIYAQYSTTATTAAEYRMYELSPVDEFTSAPDRDYLVVLGTVTVPASGTIAATSISNLYRTYAGDGIAAQAAARVQVIDDPYFSLGEAQIAGLDSTSNKYHPTVGWTQFGTVGSAADTRLEVVLDPTKKGGKLLAIKAPTPLSGAGSIAVYLQADVGLRVGDMFRDDWVDVYFEYEVVAVGTALGIQLRFEDGKQISSSYTKLFAPTVASTGVKTFHTTFRISEVEDDNFPGNFPENPVYLTSVVVAYNKASPTAGVTYLRLRELRVSMAGTEDSDGQQDAASRSRRFVETVGARIVRFANSFTGTHNLTQPFYDAPALFAKEQSGKELVLGNAYGQLSDAALRAGGTLYGGVNQTSVSTGAFETTHSTVYKLLFKSTATISIRIYANTDAVLLTSNAKITSGTTWGKDTNGTAAYALKISTGGVRFLNQIGGTNSWADAAWLDAGDALVLDALTSTWADTSGISSTTLWSMLNEIVSDLGTSGGAAKVGIPTQLYSAQTSVASVLSQSDKIRFVDWVASSRATRTQFSVESDFANFQEIAYGAGTYVTVGDNGGSFANLLYSSSDEGKTWTVRTPAGGTIVGGTLSDIVFKNSLFVFVGTKCQSSSDGITWTDRPTAPLGNVLSVDYGAGLWVVLGELVASIDRSADLTTWNSVAHAGGLRKVRFFGAQFVAVGDTIETSSDAITWTVRHTPTDPLYDLAYDGTAHIAVGDNNGIYRSTTGVTWASVAPAEFTGVGWRSVTAIPELSVFVVLSRGGRRLVSYDSGLTWTDATSVAEVFSEVPQALVGVRYLNSRLHECGNGFIGYLRSTSARNSGEPLLLQADRQTPGVTGVISRVAGGSASSFWSGASAVRAAQTSGYFFLRSAEYTALAGWQPISSAHVLGENSPRITYTSNSPQLGGRWQNVRFRAPVTPSAFVLSLSADTALENCGIEGHLSLASGDITLRSIDLTHYGTGGNTCSIIGSSYGTVRDLEVGLPTGATVPNATLESSATLVSTGQGWLIEASTFTGGRVGSMDCPAFKSTGTGKMLFRDCTFRSTSTTFAGFLIDLSSTENLVFESCRFMTATGQVLRAVTSGATFRDCYFESGSNTAGVTDPLYLLGGGKTNAPLVFENCFFKVGTANITTGVAATRAWWCLGQSTTSTTIDGGVSGRFSVKNCRVELPSAASALHRGTNMVFVGSESDAQRAEIDGLDINLSSRAFSSAGSVFNGYGNFSGTAFLHLAGRGNYQSFNGLVAKNVALRNYAGVSANVACSFFIFEGATVENFKAHAVAGAAFSHTNEVGVFDGSHVTGLVCSGIQNTYRATGSFVWSAQNYTILENSILFAAVNNILPSSAYLSVTTADVTVRHTVLDIEPTASSGSVPLVRVTGALHLISENRFRNVFADATHAPVLINTSDGTRILGNELVFGCNFSGTTVLSSTGNRCMVASNLVGSTQANSSTVTISGTGTFDGGNAQTQSIPFN